MIRFNGTQVLSPKMWCFLIEWCIALLDRPPQSKLYLQKLCKAAWLIISLHKSRILSVINSTVGCIFELLQSLCKLAHMNKTVVDRFECLCVSMSVKNLGLPEWWKSIMSYVCVLMFWYLHVCVIFSLDASTSSMSTEGGSKVRKNVNVL